MQKLAYKINSGQSVVFVLFFSLRHSFFFILIGSYIAFRREREQSLGVLVSVK